MMMIETVRNDEGIRDKTVLFPGRGSEDDSEDDLHVETQILDAEHDIDKHDQWPQSQQQTSNSSWKTLTQK